jgi:uncharacterized membrane protein YhaH (DUF805 family)
MTLSIWYAFTLIPTVIGFISVYLTRNEHIVGRLKFLVRLFGLGAFGVALAFVLRLRDENIASAIIALYLVAGCYLIAYWATSRLHDMGVRNRYWAVVTMIPIVGPIYLIYLLCAKSAVDLSPEVDDLPPIIPQEVVDAIEAEQARKAAEKSPS